MLDVRWTARIDEHPVAVSWSPDARYVAAASIDGPIHLFDAASGALRAHLPGHAIGTLALAWNADGSALASGGQDGKLRVWDPEQGIERLCLDGGATWVEHLAYNPLGGTERSSHLLASAAGRHVRLWASDGKLIREYGPHPSTVSALAWAPGRQQLVSSAYGLLATWQPSQDDPIRRYEWKGSILSIACSPNGRYIATGDQDSTVHFWITRTGRDLQMHGYPTKVRELAWDAKSRFLATGGSDVVTLWHCSRSPAGSRPQQLKGHDDLLTALHFQHRGDLLASGGEDGQVRIWSPTQTEEALATHQLEHEIAHLAWAPDDTALLVAAASGELRLFTAPPARA